MRLEVDMRFGIVLIICLYILINNIGQVFKEKEMPISNHEIQSFSPDLLQSIESSVCNLEDLETEYLCTKKIESAHLTTLMYFGDIYALEIQFNQSGERINTWHRSYCENEQLIDCIDVGMDLDTIMTMDPRGDYSFLYTGRNDTPRISVHCFKNLSVLLVRYDSNYRVVSYTIE